MDNDASVPWLYNISIRYGHYNISAIDIMEFAV